MAIPKIIHYCWIGNAEKPESVIRCIESWKKYCPEYKIIEWNETNYDFKKNKYMAQAYEAKKWGFVPDYARLDIVYEYGGIYLDTDVEIIKPFDELLQLEAFMGFESPEKDEIYVNCGQGFGAEPHNEIIKKARDQYDGLSFIMDDGELNMIPSPHYTTQILVENGLIRNNKDQKVSNVTVFSSDLLCPKNFLTGKLKLTKRTVSIHHFTASWLDEQIRNDIHKQQKIKQLFGEKLGSYVLYIESVIKKHSFISLIKKIFINLNEVLIKILDLIYILISHFDITNKKGLAIFDTSLNSDNLGDEIIVDNCTMQLSTVIANDLSKAKHYPTHIYLNKSQESELKRTKLKIVLGTNLLSGHMRNYKLWKIGKNKTPYKNTVLMGVGFDSNSNDYDSYSKLLLKSVLSKKYIHSVRDSFSEKMLKSMGFDNVINTSCPTLWKIDKSLCENIPVNKSKDVVCTITDYLRDYEADKYMIECLLRNYDNVYLWLQGEKDLEYITEIGLEKRVHLIDSSLESYDNILREKELDYVGTRLHAGIRAISFGHRTLIVSVDNRAKNISDDTGLNVVSRENIYNLEQIINDSIKTDISLPYENIELWKSQFQKGVSEK